MPEHLLDIHLDFDPLLLARERDATRTIAEVSHQAARDEAESNGRRLRHPEPVDVVLKHAADPVTGQDVLLVSTRWVTDGA